MLYPLYLTHDELTVVVDALSHTKPEPRWQEAASLASTKSQFLLDVATHNEAADKAEHAYCDLTRDDEVFELITD